MVSHETQVLTARTATRTELETARKDFAALYRAANRFVSDAARKKEYARSPARGSRPSRSALRSQTHLDGVPAQPDAARPARHEAHSQRLPTNGPR